MPTRLMPFFKKGDYDVSKSSKVCSNLTRNSLNVGVGINSAYDVKEKDISLFWESTERSWVKISSAFN